MRRAEVDTGIHIDSALQRPWWWQRPDRVGHRGASAAAMALPVLRRRESAQEGLSLRLWICMDGLRVVVLLLLLQLLPLNILPACMPG